MRRASAICRAKDVDPARIVDRVVLDADDRNRRRIALDGTQGPVLLDLAHPVQLRDGDGLVLEDGSIVLVAGAPEPLLEITAPDPPALVRLAWHLGNRHTDVQFVGGRLRIRDDHVLAGMLRGLGATVARVDAPFDPEPSGGNGHPHAHHDHHHPHE
jgi:urease accessory protein